MSTHHYNDIVNSFFSPKKVIVLTKTGIDLMSVKVSRSVSKNLESY